MGTSNRMESNRVIGSMQPQAGNRTTVKGFASKRFNRNLPLLIMFIPVIAFLLPSVISRCWAVSSPSSSII